MRATSIRWAGKGAKGRGGTARYLELPDWAIGWDWLGVLWQGWPGVGRDSFPHPGPRAAQVSWVKQPRSSGSLWVCAVRAPCTARSQAGEHLGVHVSPLCTTTRDLTRPCPSLSLFAAKASASPASPASALSLEPRLSPPLSSHLWSAVSPPSSLSIPRQANPYRSHHHHPLSSSHTTTPLRPNPPSTTPSLPRRRQQTNPTPSTSLSRSASPVPPQRALALPISR